MNLIDQALKDKLKLFDEIDRELGTESSYKNTTNKLNNNNNSQFDKIYSNFLLDQYQPKNIFNFPIFLYSTSSFGEFPLIFLPL